MDFRFDPYVSITFGSTVVGFWWYAAMTGLNDIIFYACIAMLVCLCLLMLISTIKCKQRDKRNLNLNLVMSFVGLIAISWLG